MSAKVVVFYRTQFIELNVHREVYLIYNIRRRGAEVKGNVKWFNNDKGYGFIEYLEGEDIFVHYSAIKKQGYKTLTEGQLVEFDLIETDKGLQAINVTDVVETTV